MWQVVFEREALEALRRLDRKLGKKITNKIEQLARDPYASNNNVKRLQGIDAYRLRVGDWRVVYRLRNDIVTIVVVKIANRGRCLPMKIQIIEKKGKPAFAVVPIDEWRRITEALEDKVDIAAVRRSIDSNEDGIPLDVVDRILDGQNSLKVYREWRGITQAVLAKRVGSSTAYISQIETGRRQMGKALIKRVAMTLRLPVSLLLD